MRIEGEILTEQEYDAIATNFSAEVIGDAVTEFDDDVPVAFKGLLKAAEIN